jgi:hypothetical protein
MIERAFLAKSLTTLLFLSRGEANALSEEPQILEPFGEEPRLNYQATQALAF